MPASAWTQTLTEHQAVDENRVIPVVHFLERKCLKLLCLLPKTGVEDHGEPLFAESLGALHVETVQGLNFAVIVKFRHDRTYLARK